MGLMLIQGYLEFTYLGFLTKMLILMVMEFKLLSISF